MQSSCAPLRFPHTALATSGAKKPGAFAREYGETLPPIGFGRVLQRNAEACDQESGSKRRLAMTEEKWLLVRMVNAFVNGAIAPITDETLYGTPEYWTIPADAGDCEDLVLLRRRSCSRRAFRRKCCASPWCWTSREGHAVLPSSPTARDFILDNRRNDIRNWSATNYTMLKRQSAQDPRKWCRSSPAQGSDDVRGTASK